MPVNVGNVQLPTLPPPDLAARPAQATLPVTWTQKIRQPGFWLVILATLIQFLQVLPLSPAWRAGVAAIGVALAKLGVESALEFNPGRIPWTEEQKWSQSYSLVYAGRPPIRGYVPGMIDDPYFKRPMKPTATDGTIFDPQAQPPSTRPTTIHEPIPLSPEPEGGKP